MKKQQKLTAVEATTLKEAVKSKLEVEKQLEPVVAMYNQLKTNEANILKLLADKYDFDVTKNISLVAEDTIEVFEVEKSVPEVKEKSLKKIK